MRFAHGKWRSAASVAATTLHATILGFLALAFSGLGCGDGGASGVDAGSEPATDAGTSTDSGRVDSGMRDADVMDGGDDRTRDSGASGADAGPDAGIACVLPPGTHPDVVCVIDVPGRNPGSGWSDSYSVDGRCYCESTFDHEIGDILVDTPVGQRTVREVCDALGPGPGSRPAGEPPRPVYNDIQCGNGPPNNAGDEDDCPGRVDIGRSGCGHIGPRWDLSVFQ